MKKNKRILLNIIYPGAIWSVLIAILGIGLLTFVFLTGSQDTVYASISYPITLYAVTVFVLGFPNIIRQTKTFISKNKYGDIYINDSKLRAKVSLYQGLVINLLFVAFYAFTGWRSASVWFGAVAAYYIILSLIRFILLRSVRKTSLYKNKQEHFIQELRTHRFCGYLMFVLNIGMAGMIVQMVWQNKGYQYPGLIIYASAGHAFYCLITSIINMVKFRRMDSPVLTAAKMLGFAGALMSMLALQTAMISKFGERQDSFRQIMNMVSGGGVFLIVFCMAIFMVVRANRELKKLITNNS